MPKIARIPITNVYADGDYTGRILVGPDRTPLNVLLDTGSSALALDGRKYRVNTVGGDRTTRFAQYSSYGDGSHWVGGVIRTTVSVGDAASPLTAAGINAALAYDASSDMFGKTDGILGLAYAPLDEAFAMPKDTSAHHYTSAQLRRGRQTEIEPYLIRLARKKVVSDIMSFYTRRSEIHRGGSGAADPLNQGWMILGGGEECRDLYTGAFRSVKVLADQWYNTNLKAVIVGQAPALGVHRRAVKGNYSNSIVDSGTNSLDIEPLLLKAVIGCFKPRQQAQLNASIHQGHPVPVAALNLPSWPPISFVLEGAKKDVTLRVSPHDYWQVNAPKPGVAKAAITKGDPGMTILGLPLMNGYFTVFDGEADGGRGVIKFATRT